MKLILNSVLRIPGAKCMTMKIIFYLETDLKDKKYLLIPAKLLLEEIMENVDCIQRFIMIKSSCVSTKTPMV